MGLAMPLSALTTLYIADRLWHEVRELRAGSVVASWGVTRPGKLSCLLESRDAWRMDIDDFAGKWLRWDHPTMGTWGGVVEDVGFNLQRGVIELSATTFHALLAKRRTPATYTQSSAPAGSVVLRAISDTNADDPIGFSSVAADEDGPLFIMQWRGQELIQVVGQMANSAGMEYDVMLDEWDISFEFRSQVGRDQTGSVLFAEGYHIVDGTIARSVATLVNDVLAVSGDKRYDDAAKAVVVDGASIDAYGRRQARVTYGNAGNAVALTSRAKSDLRRIARPTIPVTLRLPDTEKQLLDVRTGDTVRLWSSTANNEFAFRVVSRGVNAANGIVTLSGDAEEVA